MRKYFNNLHKLIGNTPMAKITYIYKGKENCLFFKLEWYSFSGSIKDRMALYILENEYKSGVINKNTEIVEVTSGNTGIAFASLGAYLGNKVTIFMPNKMSKERANLIRAYGAGLVPVSGGFIDSLELAERYAKQRLAYMPRQFENELNKEAHKQGLIQEINSDLNKINLKPEVFVSGVGTGGTIMAAAESFDACKIVAMQPESSPILKVGSKIGNHKIEGISDEFIPPLINLNKVDEIIDVNDNDSILMSKRLSAKLGLGVGISSGANFLACVKYQQKLKENKIIVSVFADSNKKYMSTDLFKDIIYNPNYISNSVQLKEFKII